MPAQGATISPMSVSPVGVRPLRPLPDMTRPLVLVGHSAAMRRITEEATEAAASSATVLIAGESGVGRRLIARTIHDRSARQDGPFVSVNCACLPDGRLESELFGLVETRTPGREPYGSRGRLEAADGGTIVLQEVSYLSWRLQGRLHRFVDTRMVQRIGSSVSIASDVRLIATTQLTQLHTVGRQVFRDDLFSRITLVQIEVPPLRERCDDVPALFRYFMSVRSAQRGRPGAELTSDAESCLCEYDWPGNVRELKALVDRLAETTTSDCVGVDDLPPALVRRSVARTMERWNAKPSVAGGSFSAVDHEDRDRRRDGHEPRT
jgi:transcriptional regulator with PAS, ATPase and Fis domain